MRLLISLKNIKKFYRDKEILRGINLDIYENDFIVIYGKSGGGKTTLLNILSTVDISDVSGTFLFENRDILNMSDRERTRLRARNIGYIFQDFRLIEDFNVLENVMIPAYINKLEINKIREKAKNLLKDLEIEEEHFLKYPFYLSGGQKQRVAIARALIHSPKIIIADEPTGNLDRESALKVVEIFKKYSKNKTIIVVTHDLEIFSGISNREFELKDGLIYGISN